MYTEAINHDPGITFFQTGAQLAGRPIASAHGCLTAWAAMNADLPAFVAMVSTGAVADRAAALRPSVGKRLPADSKYQGVQFRVGR